MCWLDRALCSVVPCRPYKQVASLCRTGPEQGRSGDEANGFGALSTLLDREQTTHHPSTLPVYKTQMDVVCISFAFVTAGYRYQKSTRPPARSGMKETDNKVKIGSQPQQTSPCQVRNAHPPLLSLATLAQQRRRKTGRAGGARLNVIIGVFPLSKLINNV
ncbi:hypothetical protein LY76DRAFT_357601 [Colletotrichum caudatum]|nr:hypothetical protein LY76DRAFT_357601 [Colletotrichum caudatum]